MSTGLNLDSMGLNTSTVSSGNGIDVTAAVNSILEAARGPEKLWQQQQATLTTQTTALNSLNSGLSALQTAMQALSDVSGALGANIAISSQNSTLTATASAGVPSGNREITVNSLATTASAYTDAVASADATFQAGVITLTVGNTTTDITVDGTNDTLKGLAAAINGKSLGVTASVINDAAGARLALVSSTSGTPGDLTITGNTTGLTFHKSVTGLNASLTIDGVPISSATNTVTGAIDGLTLNLVSSAPSTPVQLSIGPDTAAASRAVNNFVSAYNTVITAINGQFTVNSATNQAGPLASDSNLRSLQTALLSDVTYAMQSNNGYASLASLGIKMANDGTLSVDGSTFNGVLANHFSDVKNFFQQVSGGFGTHFATDLANLTSPTQGILSQNLTQISSQQKVLSDTISDFEDRLAEREKLLIVQYSQIDTMLRQYPVTLQSIEAQLNSLQTSQK